MTGVLLQQIQYFRTYILALSYKIGLVSSVYNKASKIFLFSASKLLIL